MNDFFKSLSKTYKTIESELRQVREHNEFLKEYANFLKAKQKEV
jgi:hypothetical protein